jgi:hypothetical protein
MCLGSTYKFLNYILADTIYKHYGGNKILTGKQKGRKMSSEGCKDRFAIEISDSY